VSAKAVSYHHCCLFAIAIDWVMRRVMERSDAGISRTDEAKLAYLDFSDDIALPE